MHFEQRERTRALLKANGLAWALFTDNALFAARAEMQAGYLTQRDSHRVGRIPTGLAVANFVIPAEQADTPFTKSRRAMQAHYLAEIQERFDTPVLTIPLLPQEVQGLQMLAELSDVMYNTAYAHTPALN